MLSLLARTAELEVAKLVSAKGRRVVLSGRREEEVAKAVEVCTELGASGATFVKTDVADEGMVKSLFDKAVQSTGRSCTASSTQEFSWVGITSSMTRRLHLT